MIIAEIKVFSKTSSIDKVSFVKKVISNKIGITAKSWKIKIAVDFSP